MIRALKAYAKALADDPFGFAGAILLITCVRLYEALGGRLFDGKSKNDGDNR